MPCPRGVSAPSGGAWSHGGGLLLGGACSRRMPGPGRVYAQGGLLPGECGDPPLRWLLCGRYVSYWNAFLSKRFITLVFFK